MRDGTERLFKDLLLAGEGDESLRLHRAVLQQAVEDYVRYRDRDWGPLADLNKQDRGLHRTYQQAKSWIFTQEKPKNLLDQVMSFVNICVHLHLDPTAMRGLCRSMTQEDLRSWMGGRSGIPRDG